jgi:hypothetical protein
MKAKALLASVLTPKVAAGLLLGGSAVLMGYLDGGTWGALLFLVGFDRVALTVWRLVSAHRRQ